MPRKTSTTSPETKTSPRDSRSYEDDANFKRAVGSGRSGEGEPSEAGSDRQREMAPVPAESGAGSENVDTRQHAANVGGQDSRDQSAKDRFSLLGRDGRQGGEARDEEVAGEQRRSEGAEPEAYASDTRDNFSRQYEEHRRREEKRGAAGADGKDDTNWTREDKGEIPGPAEEDLRSSDR